MNDDDFIVVDCPTKETSTIIYKKNIQYVTTKKKPSGDYLFSVWFSNKHGIDFVVEPKRYNHMFNLFTLKNN